MSDVKLTEMKVSHIPEIVEIEKKVFDTPWTEGMFRQEVCGMFGSRAAVARIEDRVVGYQIAWFIEEEVHLVNIAIDPDYQSRGIGRLLITRLIEEALDAGKQLVTLEVRMSNEEAQGFYRAFSFRPLGIRKGYYSDNREDALLMVLDLDDVQRRRAGGERSG